MKTIKLSLLAFLLPLLSLAQQTINYTITIDTLEREFILYVPSSYTGNSSAPLVLSYHGLGGNSQAQMDDHDFRPLAEAEGFLIAHPQGAPIFGPGLPGWNFGNDSLPDDLLFTSAMIDTISADYNINPDRVYACGMSFGGFFSVFLAGQLSDKIASIASVAGTILNNVSDSLISPSRPVSLLEIHGTEDNNVAYNGSQAAKSVQHVLDHFVAHNSCDSNPTITQLPDTDPNDGSTVERFVYGNGDSGTVVEHLKITGGGHTWPDENTNAQAVNRDINGCEEIWKFFSRFDIHGAIESPAGIVSNDGYSAVSVYPNPAYEQIRIDAEQPIKELGIYNYTGQEVFLLGSFSSAQVSIDLSSLPSGYYFVSGKTDTGMFKSALVKR